MNTTFFTIGSAAITWGALIASIATAQWLVFAGFSAFSRQRLPKGALMRPVDKPLIVSSVVFLALWLVAFDAKSLLSMESPSPAVQASAVASSAAGSCSSITTAMSGAQVQQRLGKPDEVRPEEETRGPGAVTWVYRSSRCSVHLLDDTVEFID